VGALGARGLYQIIDSELCAVPGDALRQVLVTTPPSPYLDVPEHSEALFSPRSIPRSVVLFESAIQIATPASSLVTFPRHRKDSFDAPVGHKPYQCHQDIQSP
jgi:hypothetical protein